MIKNDLVDGKYITQDYVIDSCYSGDEVTERRIMVRRNFSKEEKFLWRRNRWLRYCVHHSYR